METPVLDPMRRLLGPTWPNAPIAPRALLAPLASGLVAPRPIRRREVTPNATLVSRLDLTPSVARFFVRPDAGVPAFKPGQYFALGFEVEGTLLQRPYSTASPAGTTDEVEFLIRRVGTGSFTPFLWEAAPGRRVWLGPPKGLFTLHPGDERTHLFVSTGTGLAPFISMSEALLRSGPNAGAAEAAPRNGPTTRPRIVVVHGVSYVA